MAICTPSTVPYIACVQFTGKANHIGGAGEVSALALQGAGAKDHRHSALGHAVDEQRALVGVHSIQQQRLALGGQHPAVQDAVVVGDVCICSHQTGIGVGSDLLRGAALQSVKSWNRAR